MLERSTLRCMALAMSVLAIPGNAASHHNAASRSHAALAQQIDSILAEPAVLGSGWGVSIVASDGTTLYQHNDAERFAAASNTKLLTTTAAMSLLGSSFSTTTQVVAPNGLVRGTVHGDLVLVGAGDTSTSARALPYSLHTERAGDPLAAFNDLAAQLVQRGLREVTGNIVGDDTWFAWQPWPTGWEWNDLQWEYGAPVSALVANDNVVYLTVMPGPGPGEPASYQWLPQVQHFTVQSSVRTVAAGPGIKASIGAGRAPNTRVVNLWGTIPVGAAPQSMALAVDDPALFSAEALKQRMLEAGIRVDGIALARHRDPQVMPVDGDEATGETAASATQVPTYETAPARGTVLASRQSPPALLDLTVTNKVSQNLHAEVMLLQLNRGGRAQALATERRFLLGAGLAPGDFVLQDGSGLSRDDMVTPRAITTLLRFAAAQPWAAAYKATLPVGGIDGTLASRFTTAPLKGHVFAKTGSLGQDSSLSGYLTAASGRTVIFSILCNRHLPGTAARLAIDRIVAVIAAAE